MRAGSLPILLALALGCAPAPYRDFARAHPGWVSALPSVGIDVAEVVASLHAPATGGHDRSLIAMRTLLWSVDHWEDAVGPTAGSTSTFGIVAKVWCRSTPEQAAPVLESPIPSRPGYMEERVSWYLLPENRLSNWDHYEFVGRCLVANEFRPSSAPREERALIEFAEGLGQNMDYRAHLYRKGIALLDVGRRADALATYRFAEQTQEPHQTHHPRWVDDQGDVEYSQAVQRFRESLRMDLVNAGIL